jgi:hypothetical protein
MTISTKPFRTLHDAMHDRHSNPLPELSYLVSEQDCLPEQPPTTHRDEVSETDLTQTIIHCKLGDITRLRDMVLRANESWPPSASWLAGFRSGFANGFAAGWTR